MTAVSLTSMSRIPKDPAETHTAAGGAYMLSTSATLVAPRVKARAQATSGRPAAVPSVLHIDGGHTWAGGQNQVRLLMRELAAMNVKQTCLCPTGSALARRLQSEGLPVRAIAWQGATDPRAAFTITRLLRHYHIAHCHDTRAMQNSFFPARLTRTPIVATRRDCDRNSIFKWHRADRVIAISEAVREALIEAGIDRDRVCLIHSGIDVHEVRSLAPQKPLLRKRLGISANTFVAGTIGSLVKYKNHILLTRAAGLAADVTWLLIGDGRERARIETAVRNGGLQHSMHIVGSIEDARRTIREMDVLVSTAEGEALGTSLLDAMAAGIPVIAANSAGPGEILEQVHAETGNSLYQPGDADGLARMVLRVRNDSRTRDAMIVAQNRRIEDFRSERSAMLTLDVYREALR